MRIPAVGMLLLMVAACGGRSTAPDIRPPPPTIGTAPAEDGTGSTETVDGDDREFVQTVQEMIQGQVSGVQVLNVPGCGLTLRIRASAPSLVGNSCRQEPLLIIDGKPVAVGHMAAALKGIIPIHIERIQVLKDVASTAVYGMRGAYGVILITTER